MDALTCGEVRTQLPRVGLSPPWVPRIASRHIIYKYFHPLSCLSGLIMPLTDLYSVLGGGGVMVGSKSKSPSLDINVQVASRLLVLRPAYTGLLSLFAGAVPGCKSTEGYLEQSK